MELYNHITGKLEPFANDKTIIKWYTCGPTVHNTVHMGHARTFSIFDSLRKYLTSINKIVIFGMNITDIDDKINSKVKDIFVENDGKIDIMEIYNLFVDDKIKHFWESLSLLNISPPTKILRVSKVMDEIKNFIKTLIEKSYAYVSNDSVYFNTSRYADVFGKCELSNSTDDDMSVKDEFVSDKINQKDFALWKKAKPDSVGFESEWGKGTPGWHIECSVMSNIMFGDHIDLHTGGIDLKYPHHHNEVLQSNSFHEKPNVFEHFLYTGHVCMNGDKMAQSVGNYITVSEYLSKYSPNSLRLLFWMSPFYRAVDITDEFIEHAVSMEKRINEFIFNIYFNLKLLNSPSYELFTNSDRMTEIFESFKTIDMLLNKGFRTDCALRTFNTTMTIVNIALTNKECDHVLLKKILELTMNFLNITGFTIKHNESEDNEKFLNAFVKMREILRKEKLYKMSDYIRDVIFPQIGYVLQDTPDGSKINKQ